MGYNENFENNNVGTDRKLHLVKYIQLSHTYNEKYEEALYQICEEDTLFIYAERWEPTQPTQKLELFKGNPFGLYLENDRNVKNTCDAIWKIIKTNVKNSWLEKLTKEEKKWLKTVLYDEICVSVIH